MKVTVGLAALANAERMREVEVDAGERFRLVELDVIADDEPSSIAALKSHIDSETAWVASASDGVVVGYALASVVDDEAHLDQLSVVRAAAGSGIGRDLIDVVLSWARGRAFVSITLTTFRHVPWNGPYYERLGFVVLAANEMGPELTRIRAEEHRAGLDIEERVAMRRSTLAINR